MFLNHSIACIVPLPRPYNPLCELSLSLTLSLHLNFDINLAFSEYPCAEQQQSGRITKNQQENTHIYSMNYIYAQCLYVIYMLLILFLSLTIHILYINGNEFSALYLHIHYYYYYYCFFDFFSFCFSLFLVILSVCFFSLVVCTFGSLGMH